MNITFWGQDGNNKMMHLFGKTRNFQGTQLLSWEKWTNFR